MCVMSVMSSGEGSVVLCVCVSKGEGEVYVCVVRRARRNIKNDTKGCMYAALTHTKTGKPLSCVCGGGGFDCTRPFPAAHDERRRRRHASTSNEEELSNRNGRMKLTQLLCSFPSVCLSGLSVIKS
jgi:hypothetical protein